MILTSIVLGSVLVAQGAGLDVGRPHRSFRFVYSTTLPEVPAGARQTRLWIPIPLDTSDQEISKLTVKASGSGPEGQVDAVFTGAKPDDLKDGQREGLKWTLHDIQGGFGRSLCVESAGTSLAIELAFDVTRYETKGGGQATPSELAKLKEPNRMIPLNGKVAAVAASMKLPAAPLATARALYDHTLERMKYDKPKDQPWGRGDAEWACDAKFGNCTDFHSYFMGLARAKGLSARFEMGFPIPAGDEVETSVGGYHCWAYVWIEGHGWKPVDISEADKEPAKTDYFFGTLDCNRVTMVGGRDLTLTPSPTEGALNFFVYPYGEVDGTSTAVTKSFKRINL